MTGYTFNQLVDIEQIQKLLKSHNVLTGMAYSILDAEEHIHIAVGWQEICRRFHRVNPFTLARCRESDTYIKTHLHNFEGDHIEYRCKNGLIEVAMPVIIEGRHVATFFTGQFFYDDDRPDREFFCGQVEAFGFDLEEYFKALEQVSVFSREHVRRNVFFLHNMVQVLAETGLKNLRLARETEERRRAEEQITLMNFALDHIREAAYLVDEQARFRYVNNEACRALGYERNELLTLSVADIDSGFPMECWHEHWRDIKARGSLVVEGYHKAADDHVFPVENYITYFEFGGEGYHLALVRDITERRWMEMMLRTNEQQFRTLTENSPNIIMRYDRECRRVYVSPAYSRVTGIPADLAQNTTLDKKWPAGMNMSVKEYKSKLRRVMETGVPAEILLEWPRQDSMQASSHVFNVVVEKDPDGVIIGCLAIGHNISGRREAEFRLAKLAETSPGVMFTFLLKTDGTSCMPYVSARIEELNGLRPEDMAEDMSKAFARIHPDDIARVRESIAKSEHQLSSWHSEFRVWHPAKGDVWVEGRSIPEPQPNGDILWNGFFHDITKRKMAEESLNAKQKQLASMAVDLSLAEERERRRIASELHDHIGQMLLLSKIKLGSLAALFEGGGDDDAYHDIQELLGQTISDVRSLTQQLNPPLLSSVGLEAALEWLAKRMELDYSLQVDFSDDGSAKPLCEELRAVVFQSARELLINVAKYAATGAAWLTTGREGDRLRLVVEDRGVGFVCPPNHEMHISRSSSYGLFNIRQRIEYLGGELVIKSVPGRGTCATIHVPLMDDNSLGGEPCVPAGAKTPCA